MHRHPIPISRSVAAPRLLRQRAFSMIEVVFSVVLVSVMIVSGMRLLGATARSQLVQQDLSRATTLARQLMGEIMQQAYKDPVNDAGLLKTEADESSTTRAAFDDVDDYDKWKDLPPQKRDGTAISGYTGWSTKVRVEWIDPSTMDVSETETGLKRIKLSVTSPPALSYRSMVCDPTAARTKLSRSRPRHIQAGSASACEAAAIAPRP